MIAGRSPRDSSSAVLLAAALLAASLMGACGYMGPPLPPALNLPNRVTDLNAVQRGSRIIIQFTMSRMTTEALPIKDPPEIDMRVGESGPRFDEREWLARSRRLPSSEGQVKFETSAAEFVGHDVVIAVRLVNDRGKDAGWSNFITVPVTATVGRPERFTAKSVAQGVELSWSGSDAPLFRVFRKGDIGEFAPLGDTRQSPYVDATAEFGKPYTYLVQGIQKVGERESESELSTEAALTPIDTFPPAVPARVQTIVGPTAIQVSWDRNTESDLAGYHVFRAEGDGPFTPIGGNLVAPSYSDRAVKPGIRYRYQVSSFDLTGNESARSATAEAVLP